MYIQQKILKFITKANWMIFIFSIIISFGIFSIHFTKGIIAGGLIVTINFHLLYKTLKNSLTPPIISSHISVIIKYYIRFIISGILIFILINFKLVDPIGLILGLSVVVGSIMLATICELTKIIFREAV